MSSVPVKERQDSSEVTARAPDENKKTKILLVCNRFVK
jgi:hypothetical protein